MPKARLDSWKAIAEYLERSLRTVQRWHAYHGLPVHRFGGVKGAVFAYPEEIDRWLISLSHETREQSATKDEVLAAGKTASCDLTRTASQMWESRSERNIQTVAALFRKAIDHDPANHDALVGLANAMIFAALNGILDGAVAYPCAQDALARIGMAGIRQSSALCANAWLNLLYLHDWRQAQRDFDEVLALTPDSSFALSGRSLLHLAEQELDEARELAWQAWRARPSSSAMGSLLCLVHALSGDAPQAIDLVEQLKVSGGHYAMVISAEAYALLCVDQPEMQLETLEQLAADNKDNYPLQGMLGYLYGQLGRTTSALEILYSLDRLSRLKKRSHGYALALVHLGLDNRAMAIEWLEAAYAEGSPWSLIYRFDPLLKNLLSEQRMKRLLAQSRASESIKFIAINK